MKTIVAAALVCLAIALALPLLLAPGAAPEGPSATPGADAETVFTVLMDGEVHTVDMASYLPGVVAAEMPALFEPDALKAQAVAARSFILSRTRTVNANHPEADVCTDPGCCKAYATEDELREKWGADFDAYWQKMLAAVRETDGQYLSYEGEPIFAAFHSSSAGMTEDAGAVWNALPYLVSVPSPEEAEDVPDYVTTVSYTDGAARGLSLHIPRFRQRRLGGGCGAGRERARRVRHRLRAGDTGHGDAHPLRAALHGLHARARGGRFYLHRHRLRPRRGHEPVRRERAGGAGDAI